MANSNNNTTAIAYSTVSSVTTPKALNSTSRVDSDEVAINADAVQASLRLYCDNQGTPASGDYVDFWIKWSADGTNFDTDEHAQWVGRIDTYATNDPGEDPAGKTITLNVSGKQKFKLTAKANQGGTRTVNFTGLYNEHRMA